MNRGKRSVRQVNQVREELMKKIKKDQNMCYHNAKNNKLAISVNARDNEDQVPSISQLHAQITWHCGRKQTNTHIEQENKRKIVRE